MILKRNIRAGRMGQGEYRKGLCLMSQDNKLIIKSME